MNIVARWPGSTHDQNIFRNSNIHNRFEAGDFGRYILVGDSGYANTFFLATPYTATNAEIAHDAVMQRYQANIISTRNVVERQYGVLKRRFPMLAYGMRVRVDTAQKLIAAAAILHNMCIDAHDPQFHAIDNELVDAEAVEMVQNNNPRPPHGHARRPARDEILASYRVRVRN